jgi:hypothetical protein
MFYFITLKVNNRVQVLHLSSKKKSAEKWIVASNLPAKIEGCRYESVRYNFLINRLRSQSAE